MFDTFNNFRHYVSIIIDRTILSPKVGPPCYVGVFKFSPNYALNPAWLNSYEEKLEPSSSLTHIHYLFHNIQYKKNLENSYGAVYKVFI